ncbi:MAG TPA: Fe-S cluster assembly protein SufD [Kamptonema sp.]|nr:Fe-S cluster assembly protein SufD [Kamptonema sp.]
MIAQIINRETYLHDLVSQCRQLSQGKLESCPYGLKDLRDKAAEYLLSAAFPTTRDEEWRFTDLSPLLKIPFNLTENNQLNIGLADIGLSVSFQDELPSRLVFVNGCYAAQLSTLADDFYAGNLSDAPEKYQARICDYLSNKQQQFEVFSALNVAGLMDAAVVFVPQNHAIDIPIHLVFITMAGATPTMCQPHCLVIAEPGSSVTLVEDYVTIGNLSTFTNAVTEIFVGENAVVNHIRIQREGEEAFHIGKSAIAQSRNSRYTCHAISLGSKISRHNLEVFQGGEGTETTLNGLTMIGGEQLADTHSTIAFNHPHGTSRQLHKCIVDDKAHAVFNGKVFVPKLAQLTDAGQLNRNLLLSPKARIDTKPQLEITADNVKCSHGATVSQLEDDEVFYLQSRGLNEETSRHLLIDAFAAEIINQLPVAAVRQMLGQIVAGRT